MLLQYLEYIKLESQLFRPRFKKTLVLVKPALEKYRRKLNIIEH